MRKISVKIFSLYIVDRQRYILDMTQLRQAHITIFPKKWKYGIYRGGNR